MKAVANFISGLAFAISMLYIGLFDIDGAQLGLIVFPNSNHDLWVGLASILGNLIWLLAVFFWIAAIALSAGMLNSNMEKMVESANKMIEASPLDPVGKITRNPLQWALTGIAISIATFMIGSGFWWTGTGWLALQVVMIIFQYRMKALIAEILENGDA